jgi:hypothetical protein
MILVMMTSLSFVLFVVAGYFKPARRGIIIIFGSTLN